MIHGGPQIVIAHHGAPHWHLGRVARGDMLCYVFLPRGAEFLSSTRRSMIGAHGLMMLVPKFLLDSVICADFVCLNRASKRQVEEDVVNEVQPAKPECWNTLLDFILGHFVNSAVQKKFN